MRALPYIDFRPSLLAAAMVSARLLTACTLDRTPSHLVVVSDTRDDATTANPAATAAVDAGEPAVVSAQPVTADAAVVPAPPVATDAPVASAPAGTAGVADAAVDAPDPGRASPVDAGSAQA